jgi:PAS domain S-box-containing protein
LFSRSLLVGCRRADPKLERFQLCTFHQKRSYDHGYIPVTDLFKVGHGSGQQRGTQDEVRQSEQSFELLVRSVKDYAIFMLDPEGRIVSWNEGAARIKGYSANEIIGQSFAEFYPREAVEAGFPQYELDVAQREGRFEDEGWRLRKDGSRFWANVVITAVYGANGQLVGFAKVTRDLTERREAEKQARRLAGEQAARAEAARRSEELAQLNARLRQQADELQTALAVAKAARDAAERAAADAREAYRELDRFAYVASHDLKAPLRGIANLAQWLQDDLGEQLPGDSGKHLELLQSRARRMDALIDGILTYSRAGRRLTAPESVETGGLVRDVIELLAPPAEVTIKMPDQFPTIEAERVPLQQVFMNLIGNAVKYSCAARPDAAIHLAWRDVGDGVEFMIKDNGPGIAPEYHDRIWGIFQTLAARDQVEGTGIGLSVVKKIVESRGGSVSLESAPNEGATFRFIWPKTLRPGVTL